MSRERRIRLLRTASLIAFAIAGVAIAGFFLLSRYALPWVTGKIVQRTGYQFAARSIDFHVREGVVLKDVWIGSPEGQEIFKTPRLAVRPRWSDLFRRRMLIVEELSVDLASGRLRGQGEITKEWDVDATVEFRSFAQPVLTAPEGTLRAKLIHGRGDIVGTLRHGRLLASATAQLDIPGKTIQGTLSGGPYRWQADQAHPWDIERLTAQWSGSFSSWQVQARVTMQKGSFVRYRGTVEKTALACRINWDRVMWHLPPDTDWRTVRSGYATLTPGGLEIPDLFLTDGLGDIHLSAAVTGSNLENVSLRADHVALAPLTAWASPAHTLRGSLGGTLQIQGSLNAPTGRLDVTLSSGSLNAVLFQEVQARVRLEPPWLVLEKLTLVLPHTGRSLNGHGKIPWHLIQPASPNLPLEIGFEADDIDPQLLTNFVPGLEVEPEGHVKIRATVQGLYPDVRVEGHVEAHVPELRYRAIGMEMKEVNVVLHSNGRNVEIQQGQAQFGKGTVVLSGQVAWPKLDITLKADRASFSIPKKLEFTTDAQLHLGGTVQSPELTGHIRPQGGTYIASKSSKKDSAKPAEEKPSQMWLALRLELDASWPRGVWYRDGLTKIETSGDLRVRKDHGANNLVLLGPISLIRGSYDAYGRDFVIESGDLRFVGTPGFNPQLNIQAQYRAGDTSVNLTVLGTVEHPELRFTSSPPMNQQEILSFLVTGQASTQFGSNADGTTPDQQAKGMAAGIASTYLTQELRSSGLNLGLDVVRVTPSPTGTVWTLGRYIGPDLFVSYGQDPKNSASSVVNADYSLSRRWSINTQASSTSDSYVDLIFRYPLNRRTRSK